jgi:hypothetical protein
VPMMRVQVNSGPWENVRDTEAAAIIADAYRTGARGVHVRLLDQYPLLHGRPLTPCEYRELLEQVRRTAPTRTSRPHDDAPDRDGRAHVPRGRRRH